MTRASWLKACLIWLVGCAPLPRTPIVAITWPNGEIRCGAVAIGPHEILTAGHCATGAEVRWVTPELYSTTVRGAYTGHVRRKERDLVWIVTEGPILSSLPTRVAGSGPVWVWSPVADWGLYSGRIDQIIGSTIRTTIAVQPGWSGSPLLDSSGYVVGILSTCDGHVAYSGRETCTGASYFEAVP